MKKLLHSPLFAPLLTALIIAAVGWCWRTNAQIEVQGNDIKNVKEYMGMIWQKLEQIDQKCGQYDNINSR